jgi:hypothetical protein
MDISKIVIITCKGQELEVNQIHFPMFDDKIAGAYAQYTYDAPGGGTLIGSLLREDIMDIKLKTYTMENQTESGENPHQTEIPEHKELLDEPEEKPVPEEPGDASDEVPEKAQASDDDGVRTRLTNEQLQAIEDLKWDHDIHGFNAAVFARACWIIVQTGKFNSAGELVIDYLPSSSESETIRAIAKQLKWPYAKR